MRPGLLAALTVTVSLLASGCYEDPDSRFPDRAILDDSTWTDRTATYGQVDVHEGNTLRLVRSHITIEEDLRVWGSLELIDSTLTFRREDTNNRLVVGDNGDPEVRLVATGSTIAGLDRFNVVTATVEWTGGAIDSEQVLVDNGATARFEGVRFAVDNQPENDPGYGNGFSVGQATVWISNSTFNEDIVFDVGGSIPVRLVGSTPLEENPVAAGGANRLVEEADWVTVHLVDVQGNDVANRTVSSRWLETLEDESEAVTNADGEALLEVVHRHWANGLVRPRDPHAIMVSGPTQGQPFLAQAHLPRLEVLVPAP